MRATTERMVASREARTSRARAHGAGITLLRGVVLGAALVAVAVEMGIRFLFRTDSLRDRLSRAVSAATGGLYRSDLQDVHVSAVDRTLTAERVRFGPDPAALDRRREEGGTPATLLVITCPSVRITWRSLAAMLRGEADLASAAWTRPRFEITVDRRVASPGPPSPEPMPHERLRALERSLTVDRLLLENASVVYRETAADGVRPGTIRFDRIDAIFRDVTNDPDRQRERPCTADLRFLLAGAGDMTLRLKYDLSRPDLTLDYGGTVGRMEANALNGLLVDLEGVRVTGGALDSVTYDFRVRDGVAKGNVRMLYHGLESEVVDKVTHDAGVADKLKTFLNRHFRVHEANPPRPGEAVVEVAVERRRTPDVKFVKFLWENLRAGVYETLGV